MTTTSPRVNRHSFASIILLAATTMVLLASCVKNDYHPNNGNSVSTFSSDVLDKWISLEIRLMRNATGIPNQAFSRHYAYAGIAALASVSPGLPANANWMNRFNGLTGLPAPDPSVKYYYPANVNAAMASILHSMFPAASVADKFSIDSLENALKQHFLTMQPVTSIEESAMYGKAVADAVYEWAETDGYKQASNPYTAPTGPGKWVPTAPAFSSASTPFWGNNRTTITGSSQNTQPVAPIAFSTEENSAFYLMVKQVYDVSQNLTDAEKAMAIFWRDVPGVTSPGHWLSILQQAIRQSNARLDKAVISFALTGAAINDGLISCWKAKYQHSLVRPITYIRDVMGHGTWTSFLGTPPHPEYPSAHAVLSVAAGEVMDKIFTNINSFTDHTYDYMGFAPRTYTSFRAVGIEAAQSRLYAGIHYQPSIEAGIIQGINVADNILSVSPAH